MAPFLSTVERQRLSRELLQKTLSIILGARELGGVVVVSRDADALSLAQRAGAIPLSEAEAPYRLQTMPDQALDPEFYLNEALRQARQHATASGADAILVLPADLPLLSSMDLQLLIQKGKSQDVGLVITPSRDGGTNALLLRPPDIIDFAYGPDSFHRHITQASERGVPVQIVESANLALDLDLPEDLVQWQALRHG